MDNLTKYKELNLELEFNPKLPTILHLDLNSCFATIEQQANPSLRGKPIAVAAYNSDSGCIVAPSIEAKRYGIKTGMRVRDGKLLYPGLIVLSPDPWKYRNVHLSLRKLLKRYTDDLVAKSIDEFVLNLEGYPAFNRGMVIIAQEIKERIKIEIGEWLTVSIGIAPNRFLAKTGASLCKPDGLDVIDINNYMEVYRNLKLTDLCGIKTNNAVRLHNVGIHTTLDFYKSSILTLNKAFGSIAGYYWFLRLRGWEIDDVEFARRSYGNSYAIPEERINPEDLSPILHKLTEKMTFRLRKAGYKARGIHVSILYRNGCHWHQGKSFSELLFASNDVYKEAYKLLTYSPYRLPVHTLAVSCFDLNKSNLMQLNFFEDTVKKESLTKALDGINEKYGGYVITPAIMIGTHNAVPDRVAFGGVKELEEFITTNED